MGIEDKINKEDYSTRFDDWEVDSLFLAKVPPKIANGYHPKFSGSEITEFFQTKVTSEIAEKYSPRFRYYWDIVSLFQANCPPEIANKYPLRFNGEDIANLFQANCPPEIANKYPLRFNGLDITNLFQANCPPEIAEKYSLRFRYYWEIIDLFEVNCLPEIANNYPLRFYSYDIKHLFEAKVPPEIADKYGLRFGGNEIAYLFQVNCPPEIASQYSIELRGMYLSILYTIGIKPDKIDVEKQKQLKKILYKIIRFGAVMSSCLDEEAKQNEKFSFISTGSSGVILLRENIKGNQKTAWKFAQNILPEYELLKKIRDKNPSLENVVEIKGDVKEDIAIELEYVSGKSLEAILKEKEKLSSDKIIRYAKQIMNGFIEMRKAGVWYHRDMRPANIIIDEEKDRAVIIDLGYATTDRHKWCRLEGNRRFNGPNDLVSMGQIIYFMAAGKHLFAESESMTKTLTSVAEEINDYRTKIYGEETGALLKKYLAKVDERIENKNLKFLIKECLTAKHYCYGKINRFLKALNES